MTIEERRKKIPYTTIHIKNVTDSVIENVSVLNYDYKNQSALKYTGRGYGSYDKILRVFGAMSSGLKCHGPIFKIIQEPERNIQTIEQLNCKIQLWNYELSGRCLLSEYLSLECIDIESFIYKCVSDHRPDGVITMLLDNLSDIVVSKILPGITLEVQIYDEKSQENFDYPNSSKA